jgi:hypothetical protein
VLRVIFIGLLLELSGCHRYGPVADAALDALRKVQAKVQVGISEDAYLSVVGDANFAVQQYVNSKPPSAEKGFGDAVEGSLKWYKAAADVWSTELHNVPDDYLACTTGESLCEDYPELVMTDFVTDKREIQYKSAVQRAWALADTQLDKAVTARGK